MTGFRSYGIIINFLGIWKLKYLWVKCHDICNLVSNASKSHLKRESKQRKITKIGELGEEYVLYLGEEYVLCIILPNFL